MSGWAGGTIGQAQTDLAELRVAAFEKVGVLSCAERNLEGGRVLAILGSAVQIVAGYELGDLALICPAAASIDENRGHRGMEGEVATCHGVE